jgi:ring-1,2-phenylacetyl-CoA epoxidase subunit PaaE
MRMPAIQPETFAASAPAPAPPSHSPRFHRLTVADICRETSDSVSIVFDIPEELASEYRFSPGQYLTLRAVIDGEDTRRSYSICSGPGDSDLRVLVKKVEDGLFSSWINDNLRIGDELEVMTPTGRFGLAHAPGNGRIHVGFAAGSGITPILSILRGVLELEPDSRFFLFYGSRSTADILFRNALEELKDRFLDRLSIFHVLSREEQDIPILNGHLDGEKIRRFLTSIIPAALVDHAFICGPEGMIGDVEATLRQLGISEDRIHTERFLSVQGGRPRRSAKIAADAPPAHVAALIVDGKRRDVPVAAGETVLDAALRAGMDLPFACKGGMCSTCRARIAEGEVSMDVNYSLEPWEIEAGFVLTCQSHPRSARLVVDFDHL